MPLAERLIKDYEVAVLRYTSVPVVQPVRTIKDRVDPLVDQQYWGQQIVNALLKPEFVGTIFGRSAFVQLIKDETDRQQLADDLARFAQKHGLKIDPARFHLDVISPEAKIQSAIIQVLVSHGLPADDTNILSMKQTVSINEIGVEDEVVRDGVPRVITRFEVVAKANSPAEDPVVQAMVRAFRQINLEGRTVPSSRYTPDDSGTEVSVLAADGKPDLITVQT
ncbi:MAG: hypothetical protein HQL18_04490 [Candidatus Omnitrophica bacterium]|nr:hypothetical protein [Candidatus Omnitrophota bacterium]